MRARRSISRARAPLAAIARKNTSSSNGVACTRRSSHEVARVERRQCVGAIGREAEADEALATAVVHVALELDDGRVAAPQIARCPAAGGEQHERVEDLAVETRGVRER